MPPQEFQQISQFFYAVDTDKSGHITAEELHKALSLGGSNFSIDVVNKLLSIFDNDRSGHIGEYFTQITQKKNNTIINILIF